jgi:alpha,alpha-trehalase
MRRASRGAVLAVILGFGAVCARAAPAPASPAQLFQELYVAVETQRIFPDDKTFADAVPKAAPEAILADYRARAPLSDAELRAFVDAHFTLPQDAATVSPKPGASLREHIRELWPILTRQPAPAAGSMLGLPAPYVVPGGRFRELYYWDSYFTMLGLEADGRTDLVASMTEDFASLVRRYGHIPNGSRTYYLSRSQPPVFYLMVDLVGPGAGRYLPELRAEHAFWMEGERSAKAGRPAGHVVGLPDGAVLNRYWDAEARPRDESYRTDLELAESARRPSAGLYRDLRSAAESGWDFSSRWMADGTSLATTRTTSIAPADLNSLLFGLEREIALLCAQRADRPCAAEFRGRAERRRRAMDRYLWDAAQGAFLDYDWRSGRRLPEVTAATLYPLFAGLASPAQARAVAAMARHVLLAPGGLRTTTRRTGQQWDAPNGWAPLQWIAVEGLRRNGQAGLADDVASRWLATVCRTYRSQGRLLEKYDVETPGAGGGGEYPLQDGFGWTNGVTVALAEQSPGRLAADGCADSGMAGGADRMQPASNGR